MYKISCDKCGKEIGENEFSARLVWWFTNCKELPRGCKTKDYCKKCNEKIKKAVESVE